MPLVEYIKSLEDLNDQSAFIILYRPGSSGEFLASALAESIDDITPPPTETKDNGSTIYREFFGHELKNKNNILNSTELIYRANVALNAFKSNHYIILVHPKYFTLKFLTDYLNKRPLIEIVMNNQVSRKFAESSVLIKIRNKLPAAQQKPVNYQQSIFSDYRHPLHLQIEWSDLILDRTSESFDLIQNFLGLTGNKEKFENCVAEYQERNRELIKQAYEI
jgi:hypothetical protein